ncbi:MAG TPA: GatB/YqeY domain-containing protein [Candidatus Eremiobacteraceae bacterium]|nr:GatB/YqeY domain-containing protein [Candidatus Eremiobacteraceae bacterium]
MARRGNAVTSTIDRLNSDLKEAMKARDAERTGTLRMAISAMKYRTIERNAQLSDEEQLDVLRKQVKQRNDSIEEYTKAGRTDLADKEQRERTILEEYLPARMTGDALQAAVKAALTGLSADAKFGDAMKTAMAALKDQADGKAIQEAVKAEMSARGGS